MRGDGKMEWNCEKKYISDETIANIESQLGISFPNDFIETIKRYDGGYPLKKNISIGGKGEILNNLVSFDDEDESFILDIVNDTEFLAGSGLVPIAEDPFGNLFCYEFENSQSKIVFWDHEENGDRTYICDTFAQLLLMLE